jgi:hypothetical protein
MVSIIFVNASKHIMPIGDLFLVRANLLYFMFLQMILIGQL